MVCPKCNTQLAPGNVYCPKCGQEVQIVPDYDPLDEVLWDGPDKERQEKVKKESVNTGKKQPCSFSDYLRMGKRNRIMLRVVLLVFVLVVCVCTAITSYVLVRRKKDYGYQLKQGMSLYTDGKLEEAILYLKKACELRGEAEKQDERPMLYLARIYREYGEFDLAAELLEELLEYEMGEKQKIELYEELFQVLQESKKADCINELIDSCSDEVLRKRLAAYRIEQPRVSIGGGVYHYYIYPRLEADYGNIYYTLDGSTPTKDSIPYTGKIELQEGDNLLTAVAINEKGIVSEQLFEVYTLDFNVPMDTSNRNDSVRYD